MLGCGVLTIDLYPICIHCVTSTNYTLRNYVIASANGIAHCHWGSRLGALLCCADWQINNTHPLASTSESKTLTVMEKNVAT